MWEVTALPRPPSCIKGRREGSGREKKERGEGEKKRREEGKKGKGPERKGVRPAHFSGASAAYE